LRGIKKLEKENKKTTKENRRKMRRITKEYGEGKQREKEN
jgi:hypothetical protein